MNDVHIGDGRASPYHHGDLRNAFCVAALALVEKRGVHAFSLREAARTIGVSAAAAYRHFAGKEALLETLAREGERRMADAMVAAGGVAREGQTPAESIAQLFAYGRAILDFSLAHPAYFRLMSSCEATERGEPAPIAALALQAFDELIRAGALRASERRRAILAAWAGVFGLAWLVLEGMAPSDEQGFRRDALDAVLRTALLGVGIDEELLPTPAEG